MEKINDFKETKVELWNPDTAVNWSVLFSPVLGSWIQMKNWQALNEHDKARQSRYWMFASVPFFCFLPLILPHVLFWFIWYTFSGLKQTQYVKDSGIQFTKKAWMVPILVIAAVYPCFLMALFIAMSIVGIFYN